MTDTIADESPRAIVLGLIACLRRGQGELTFDQRIAPLVARIRDVPQPDLSELAHALVELAYWLDTVQRSPHAAQRVLELAVAATLRLAPRMSRAPFEPARQESSPLSVPRGRGVTLRTRRKHHD